MVAVSNCGCQYVFQSVFRMPYLRIETNLPRSKIPADFTEKAVLLVAKTLEKPEIYVAAAVIPDMMMYFGGSTEPCVYADLLSIGKLGVEANKKHSKVIFDFVEKELGIPGDRMYLRFQDDKTSNVGFKHTTFHTMFGETQHLM